jgi:hypothetical protein
MRMLLVAEHSTTINTTDGMDTYITIVPRGVVVGAAQRSPESVN